MATVNYSVPDEIKTLFNQVFADENKSHIIAELMKKAIEERKKQQQRAHAIDALLKLRDKQKSVSTKVVKAILKETRK